jgi:hypothetical protein
MRVKSVSSVESAFSEAQLMKLRGLEVIAAGLVINNGQSYRKIALIDVTPEVRSGQLDTRDLKLVDTFIHAKESEILNQVKEVVNTAEKAFAVGRA